ncbi:hypothetical protein [Streptomyces fractus]|uniref:hypothetical protein n=1 Tax=Streptomyces fractus TaxID=641806 RepID=UPI003CF7DF1C
MPIALTDIAEGTGFAYRARIGEAAHLQALHHLTPVEAGRWSTLPGGGTKITHRYEITGLAAGRIAPGFATNIAHAVTRLAELACLNEVTE